VRAYIGRRADIPPALIRVTPPITPEEPRVVAAGAEQPKTSDLLRSPEEYRLSIDSNPTVPILNIYAEAPDAASAERLANAAVAGLRDYLGALAVKQHTPARDEVKLNQLGRAKGAPINSGAGTSMALAVFFLVLLFSSALVIFVTRVRRGWSATAGGGAPARAG
jgi:hypothetical protein